MLKKADKLKFFHAPVLQNFMGHKGLYADVIKKPMDFGTVLIQIDTKYRWATVATIFLSDEDMNVMCVTVYKILLRTVPYMT